MALRLLLLVHGLTVGGTEVMVSHLARGLRGRGLEVAIGCLDEIGDLGRELLAEGFAVRRYGRRPGFDARLPLRIARHAGEHAADVIHAHQYTPFFYGVLAKPLTRAGFVFTEHGRGYPDPPSRRRRAFNAVFGRLADRVTAVSEGVRESLCAVEGFDARRVAIVYNGIELDRFAGLTREEARRRLELPQGVPILGTVGRLDPIKNYPLLIEAFRRVRRDWPSALLLIVGDGPERGRLEELARALGLGESVRFLGQRFDVERILPALDVFALSSFSEGLPMTLIEAAAASVPIVATAVGGVPEAVRDGREALLLPGPPPALADPPSLASAEYPGLFASAVGRLLAEDGLAQTLARAARQRAREQFSLEAVCDRYQALYDGVRSAARAHGATISGPADRS